MYTALAVCYNHVRVREQTFSKLELCFCIGALVNVVIYRMKFQYILSA